MRYHKSQYTYEVPQHLWRHMGLGSNYRATRTWRKQSEVPCSGFYSQMGQPQSACNSTSSFRKNYPSTVTNLFVPLHHDNGLVNRHASLVTVTKPAALNSKHERNFAGWHHTVTRSLLITLLTQRQLLMRLQCRAKCSQLLIRYFEKPVRWHSS